MSIHLTYLKTVCMSYILFQKPFFVYWLQNVSVQISSFYQAKPFFQRSGNMDNQNLTNPEISGDKISISTKLQGSHNDIWHLAWLTAVKWRFAISEPV